ncbi:hypothetical protein GW17_00023750 [Ensete ventricosum]|nr:hypothetical protein GW17_00023750 [Ensete ventricosum]
MFLGVRQQFRGQKSVAALAAQLGGCLAGGCLAASRATRWLLGSRAERCSGKEWSGPARQETHVSRRQTITYSASVASRATRWLLGRWLLGAAQLGELLGAYLPACRRTMKIACRRESVAKLAAQLGELLGGFVREQGFYKMYDGLLGN